MKNINKPGFLNHTALFFTALMLIGVACKKDQNPASPVPFDSGKQVGQITDGSLLELSGMAAAALQNGYWAHGDGGNPDSIFLLDSLGNLLGKSKLKNTQNEDWEDICAIKEVGGRTLFIGDIGDNQTGRDSIFIYRCKEPTLLNADINGVEKIIATFPNDSEDAETLMIDPITRDLYIVTKANTAQVFRLKYPYLPIPAVNVFEKIGDINISKATAGDISPDGSEVVVRNNATIFYWKKQAGEDFAALFARAPAELPLLSEAQGEAVCFNRSATGLLTTTESKNGSEQPIHFYKRQ